MFRVFRVKGLVFRDNSHERSAHSNPVPCLVYAFVFVFVFGVCVWVCVWVHDGNACVRWPLDISATASAVPKP